jgi:hypothetical protein
VTCGTTAPSNPFGAGLAREKSIYYLLGLIKGYRSHHLRHHSILLIPAPAVLQKVNTSQATRVEQSHHRASQSGGYLGCRDLS